MPLVTITPPAATPVSLAEAKAFARVQDDASDALIGDLITAATELVETTTGRAFVQRTYELRLSDFPCYRAGIITLPRSPLVELVHVKHRDWDGALQTLVNGVDYIAEASEPPVIEPVRNWPVSGIAADAVQVRFTAGYPPGAGSPPLHTANLPARARVAVMALVAFWFDERVPVPDTARITEMPLHVSRLLASLRVWG